MTRRGANYPLTSARVVLLFVLGAVAIVAGVIESVGRVPLMWAALLAGVGAVSTTVRLCIYVVREAGRRP